MDGLLQDVRYALRGLRRNPGFALVAVLSLGLAIGLNTLVFTWMDRLVLHPLLGVPQSDALVSLGLQAENGGGNNFGYLDFRDWRDGARSFEGMAAYGDLPPVSLRTDGPAQQAFAQAVTWNLFDVMRVRPALGRTFRQDEEGGRVPVAVISYHLWQRTFGGDSGIVGRQVMLNGRDFTIVGVTPRRFSGITLGLRYDLWIPVTLVEPVAGWDGALDVRGWRFLEGGIARLRPGVGLDQARQDVNAVHQRLVEAYTIHRNTSVALGWQADVGSGVGLRGIIGALYGVTLVVLLIACANLASLLLSRATARQGEIGIRLAIGAGRWRLARLLLIESLVLAVCGGTLGVLLAAWAKDAPQALLPVTNLPLGIDLSVNPVVVAAAAAVTVATAIVFGLVPALRATRLGPQSTLRPGAPGGATRRSRLQSGLVTAQVTLSLVALVCAGLFVRSLQRAHAVDTGIRQPDHLLLADVNTTMAHYSDSAGAALVDRLLDRVRALPGVRSASVATQLPLGLGGFAWISVEAEGYTFAPEENRTALISWVASQYFETAGVPIVRGRGITDQDRPGAPDVIVVNQAFARRFWPGQDPLGKRVRFGGSTNPWRTVVGVAGDVKGRSLAGAAPPTFYRPIQQSYSSRFTLHVRAEGDPRLLERAVRGALEELDPNLPLARVRTMAEHMSAASWVQRMGAWSLAVFGALALILTTVGVYGVFSYAVRQRTRELGIRIALGASPRDVLALVLGDALKLTGVGLAAGAALAAGAGYLLRSLILGVSPIDPLTYLGMIAVLSTVALLAAWLPARRAARVDPVIALQAE